MSNATNSEDRLESILGQVRVLKAKYDERAEVTGENFNVFSILDRESDEVKTHSAFIAELLNPHGSHSQKTLFLKLFLGKLLKKLQKEQKAQKELEELRKKLEQVQEKNEFDKFEVEVETSKENKQGEALGRIDILIESDGINSGDVCIVIENKIYAEDQPRQLGRYYEYALDTGKKRGIIYLTLGGDEPGEFTLYGGDPSEFYGENKIPLCRKLPEDTVVCLSYREFIVTWVDDCIKEVVRIPQIRETLHQYQMLLKELAGQPINRRFAMELKNILLDKDENYNLISKLDIAISEAKFDLEYKFWTELETQLEKRTELEKLNVVNENLRYEIYGKNLGIEVYGKNQGSGREDELKACIKDGSTQSYPGLTFRLSGDENREIVFRIECSPGYLSYGFVLCEKGKRANIDNAKRREYPYLEPSMIDEEWKEAYAKGWFAYKDWKYPVIDFRNYKSVTEYKKHTGEVVKKLVDEICEVVKKISEQEQGAIT